MERTSPRQIHFPRGRTAGTSAVRSTVISGVTVAILFLLLGAVFVTISPENEGVVRARTGMDHRAEVGPIGSVATGSIPMAGFMENRGQSWNAEVRYYGVVGELRVGFADGAVLLVKRHGDRVALVRLEFGGSDRTVPEGRGEMSGRAYYLIGQDSAQWRSEVRAYEEVVYRDVYKGIDLVYRIGPTGLKYTFLVRPGADPSQISVT